MTPLCPYCESTEVYRSSSYIEHAFRTAFDSNKRYCRQCKKRWQSKTSGGWQPRIYGVFLLSLFFLTILLGLHLSQPQNRLARFFRRSPAVSNSLFTDQELLNQRIKAGKILRHAQFIERQSKRNFSS